MFPFDDVIMIRKAAIVEVGMGVGVGYPQLFLFCYVLNWRSLVRDKYDNGLSWLVEFEKECVYAPKQYSIIGDAT